MAIMGFLVHTLPEACEQVERQVADMPEMTTYGVHQDCYVVAVAEAPSAELEEALGRVRRFDGVLNCYVTSLTTEDEQDTAESG